MHAFMRCAAALPLRSSSRPHSTHARSVGFLLIYCVRFVAVCALCWVGGSEGCGEERRGLWLHPTRRCCSSLPRPFVASCRCDHCCPLCRSSSPCLLCYLPLPAVSFAVARPCRPLRVLPRLSGQRDAILPHEASHSEPNAIRGAEARRAHAPFGIDLTPLLSFCVCVDRSPLLFSLDSRIRRTRIAPSAVLLQRSMSSAFGLDSTSTAAASVSSASLASDTASHPLTSFASGAATGMAPPVAPAATSAAGLSVSAFGSSASVAASGFGEQQQSAPLCSDDPQPRPLSVDPKGTRWLVPFRPLIESSIVTIEGQKLLTRSVYQSLTVLLEFMNKSFEELRVEDEAIGTHQPIQYPQQMQPVSASPPTALPAHPVAQLPPAASVSGAVASVSLPAVPTPPDVVGVVSASPATAAEADFSAFCSSAASASPFASVFVVPAPPTATARLLSIDDHQFPSALVEHLRTREGVFALNWHESLNGSALLTRYINVGAVPWSADLTLIRLEQAHGWIVEKLEAELAAGHGYDHEARDRNGSTALDLLLRHWFARHHRLVVPMSRVLLAAPSVAARLREGGDHSETMRLVGLFVSPRSDPAQQESAFEIISMIVACGGSLEQALQPIVAQSHMQLLLQLIKAATTHQLRSIPPSALLKQAREIEQKRPYLSRRRLCRELIERVCDAAAEFAAATEQPLTASASSALSSSTSVSASASALPSPSLSAWLSEFESTLPRRMIADEHSPNGWAALRAALPQFDWLDLAEEGLMQRLLKSDAIATTERVKQLAERERARADDEPLSPASGPLSTPAILAHLIVHALFSMSQGVDPTGALLRELLSAATAPVFAACSASSPSGLCIPTACDAIMHLPVDRLIPTVQLFAEAGVSVSSYGSLTLRLIRSGDCAALQRWFAPDNAHISMPLGWLGERDPTLSSAASSGALAPAFVAAPGSIAPAPSLQPLPPPSSVPQPHPHLTAESRCDVWDAVCRRTAGPTSAFGMSPAEPSAQTAPRSLVQHAIDWHYATVTPRLRDALSPHLIPDLHAEVLSWLMPPSTLRDPVPDATESDSATLRLLDSALAALLPSQTALAAHLHAAQQQVRQLQHQLWETRVASSFAERALEAERQLMRIGWT